MVFIVPVATDSRVGVNASSSEMGHNSPVAKPGEGLLSDIRDDTRAGFTTIFGREPHGLWSAPGALRLIGDHTEYADCHTLCMALDVRTVVALGVRNDRVIRVASTERDEIAEIALDALDPEEIEGWPQYPLGIAWALGQFGADLQAVPGVDLYIESDVPSDVRMGSSVALTVAVAMALNDAWQVGLDRFTLARACARVEGFVTGEEVGVALPVTALTSTDGNGVLFDGRSRDFEQIPLHFREHDVALMVIATEGTKADIPPLATRLRAIEGIVDSLGAGSLREITSSQLAQINDEDKLTMVPLATHIVRENARVLEVVKTLREKGPEAIGELLLEAHHSLADAFGPHPAEINLAVDTAVENGAFGARLLGHQPSGSVLAVLPTSSISRVSQALDGAFSEHGFAAPDVYIAYPSVQATRH